MGVGTRKPDGKIDKTIYDRGGGWHTDSPWDTEICKGTQLYASPSRPMAATRCSPACTTPTTTLPENLKKRIDGLKAEHVYGGRGRRGNDLLDPEDRNRPPAVHPDRAHPRGDRPQVALCQPLPHHCASRGSSEAESEALIAELTDHMVATTAQYRHKWQVGDIVIWDNRCALHSATGGYPIEEPRIHWRVTIMQDAAEAQKAA